MSAELLWIGVREIGVKDKLAHNEVLFRRERSPGRRHFCNRHDGLVQAMRRMMSNQKAAGDK